MSKASAPVPAKKANSKDALIIKCVLEDVLPTSSDAVIKVKTFKKFLDYDLKTLNITGELETYTHKNGFTHTKVVVTYQDKKTNKVNYLEIDVLDNTNTNKKVENTKNCDACNSGGCDEYAAQNCTPYGTGVQCYCNNYGDPCCSCQNNDYVTCYTTTSNGTVTTSTGTGGTAGSAAAKTGKTNTLVPGTPVAARTVGTQYTVSMIAKV